ncbi:MAG: hypothetical protein OXQ90_07735 [Gammaproteobacteria bacterium]|nr:hypothetical protein [Gammaproteobacteria bacterium]
MPAYLLGTQALVDASRNETTAIHDWAGVEEVAEDQVVASVASFTLLKHKVELLPHSQRGPWQRLFDATVARFRAVDCIIPVNLDIALRAAELRSLSLETDSGGQPESLGDLGIIVAATALEEHLTLVDRRQPYHETLESSHGLAFHDPYP